VTRKGGAPPGIPTLDEPRVSWYFAFSHEMPFSKAATLVDDPFMERDSSESWSDFEGLFVSIEQAQMPFLGRCIGALFFVRGPTAV